MSRARTLGWLALRAATGSGGVLRNPLTATLLVGAAVLSFLALASWGAVQAVSAHEARVYGLTPQVVGYAKLGRLVDTGTLATLDPDSDTSRRWRGHEITRAYYARGSSTLVVPGLAAMPEPGQYYASPALAEIITEDPVVAALFDGHRQVGRIASSGLVHPGELRAVVGVSHRTRALVPVTGFGAPAPPTAQPGYRATLTRLVLALGLVVVWVSAMAFLVLVTRLAQQRRQRYARSLRLLGLTGREVRTVAAAAAVLVAAPGAALAAVAFTPVTRRVTEVPGTGFGFFPEDLGVGLPHLVAAPTLTALLAGLSTAIAVRSDDRDVAIVHTAPAGWPARLGGWLLTGGLAYLLGLTLWTELFGTDLFAGPAGAVAALSLWGASGVVAAGFALVVPRLLAQVFGRAAARVYDAGVLVGLRTHRDGAAVSARLGALLGVLIILLFGILGYAGALNGGSVANWEAVAASTPRVPVRVDDFSGQLRLADVRAAGPLGAALQRRSTNRDGVQVVFGDCRDVEILTGVAGTGCTGQPQWLRVGDDDPLPDRAAGASVTVAGVGRIPLPGSDAVLRNDRLPAELDGAVLLPASRAATEPLDRDVAGYYLLVPGRDLDVALARLSAISPNLLNLDLGPLNRKNPDDQPFPAQVHGLALAAVIALVLGVLGILAVTAAETRERAPALRLLGLLGAPRGHTARAHAVIAGLPVLCTGLLAVGVGGLVTLAQHAFDDRATVPWSTAGQLVAGIAVVSVLLPVVTYREQHTL